MRVIGIDPGSVVCGYGVIDYDGAKLSLVEYGVIEAKKLHDDFYLRLRDIHERINECVERTSPDESAFEAMFYAKNAQTLIKLAHARSAAMLSVLLKNIPVNEYAAKEVKKAVTGRGAADKSQVQFMVKNILSIDETHQFYDATDALAVAICHATRCNTKKSSSKSWADFVKNNPDRVL